MGVGKGREDRGGRMYIPGHNRSVYIYIYIYIIYIYIYIYL